MFEEIFFPRTAERYRAAPLVEQRERYLVHLRETGARRPTLRKCANDQLSLVRLLNLKEGGMPADDCLGPHARRRRLRDRRVLQRETMLHLRIFLARKLEEGAGRNEAAVALVETPPLRSEI